MRSRWSLFAAVAAAAIAGVAAGAAFASPGDNWEGTAAFPLGGKIQFESGPGGCCTNPTTVATGVRLTATIQNDTAGGAYTVSAKGRLFGEQFTPASSGDGFVEEFGYIAAADLIDSSGATVCSGRMVAGGIGDRFYAEATFGSSCPVMQGRQYLAFGVDSFRNPAGLDVTTTQR